MTPALQFDWHVENTVHVANKVTGRAEVSRLVWLPSWVPWGAAEDGDTPDVDDSYTDVLADMIDEELADYESDAEYAQDSQEDKGDVETRETVDSTASAKTLEDIRMCLKWEHPVSECCISGANKTGLIDTFVDPNQLHLHSPHLHTAAFCQRNN